MDSKCLFVNILQLESFLRAIDVENEEFDERTTRVLKGRSSFFRTDARGQERKKGGGTELAKKDEGK